MAGNFGFTDGLNLASRLNLHDRLVQSLREIGTPDQNISGLDAKWQQGIGVIYHRAIAPLIDGREEKHLVNRDATEDQKKARAGWDELLDFEQWNAPTPAEMTTYLIAVGFLSDEINEWIDDYRQFLETGEINRREVFVTQ